MGVHRLSKEDLDVRNAKILKMAEFGCDYADIGRRYGISRDTVSSLLRRKHGKKGFASNLRTNSRWAWASTVDGIH